MYVYFFLEKWGEEKLDKGIEVGIKRIKWGYFGWIWLLFYGWI